MKKIRLYSQPHQMEIFLADLETAALAQRYQQESKEIIQKINTFLKPAIEKKEGQNLQFFEQKYREAFDKLWQSILIYNTCRQSKKVVENSLFYLKQKFPTPEAAAGDLDKLKQLKNFISSYIKYLTEQEQVTTLVECIVLYRRIRRAADLVSFAHKLVSVALRMTPKTSEKENIRKIIIGTYDELLFYTEKDEQKNVWCELLRYQLAQISPNYELLLNIYHRYFSLGYTAFALYLLQNQSQKAKQLIQYFQIRKYSYMSHRRLSFLEKTLNFFQQRNVKKLERIITEEIYKRDWEDLSMLFRKLLLSIPRCEVKKEVNNNNHPNQSLIEY